MAVDGQALFGKPYSGSFEGNSVNAKLGIEPMLENTQLTLTFEKPIENIEKLVEQLANVYSKITSSESVIKKSDDKDLPNTWHIYKSGLEKEVLAGAPIYLITVVADGNKCKIDIFNDADPRLRADEAKHIVYMFGKSCKPIKKKA